MFDFCKQSAGEPYWVDTQKHGAHTVIQVDAYVLDEHTTSIFRVEGIRFKLC